ncbi:MAG: hypothetical protein ACRCUJ_01880 [Phocaeicola sp.]
MQLNRKKSKVFGISRSTKFSPNHIENDAAIFLAVTKELEALGYQVTIHSEEQFLQEEKSEKTIFGMMREEDVLNKLLQLEESGTTVVNSAQGIKRCTRKILTETLVANQIPHPKSHIIRTEKPFNYNSYPYWIKRGDAHAVEKQDVCYVTNLKEAEKVLMEFKERNIKEAIVNEHLSGDLVKFYGVAGTDFFHWFYPSPCSHSKFGLEKINGDSKGYSFDPVLLQKQSNQAATILNVPIYGGDAIIAANGSIKIIDFNDWPSFAPCRERAAFYIAQRIAKEIENQ